MARKRRKIEAMSNSQGTTRLVTLPKGGTLELEIHPGFYDRVRLHFGLEPGDQIDDDRLRMFVFGALKGAVDKAEEEMLGDAGPKINAR